MIIKGRFIGNAPYFVAHLQSTHFQGITWLLVDTGASRTTLLDYDVRQLRVPPQALHPIPMLTGIGGSVPSFLVRDVEIALASDSGMVVLQQDLYAVQHDLNQLSSEQVRQILRLPSVLGRDVISHFRFTYDYQARIVQLER
jgi:hypothetical protein